jgi:hypothetical protein
MAAIGKPVQPENWQITKFIDGMRDDLKREVSRIYRRSPKLSLEDVMSEAEMEEPSLKSKPTSITPQVQGLQTNPPQRHGQSKRNNNQKAPVCFFCKSRGHVMKDCPKVAKKRAAGQWEDRSRNGAGPSS